VSLLARCKLAISTMVSPSFARWMTIVGSPPLFLPHSLVMDISSSFFLWGHAW
jgi:hypothetical protein